MHAVKAAANVCEAKRADQTLRNMVALDCCQTRIGRRDFSTVIEFKTTQFQAAGFITADAFETDERLFDEYAAVLSAIRGEVGPTQTELTLRRWRNNIVRQSNED